MLLKIEGVTCWSAENDADWGAGEGNASFKSTWCRFNVRCDSVDALLCSDPGGPRDDVMLNASTSI